MITGVSSCVLVLLLIVAARHQLAYWENSIAMFTLILAVTENNYIAHANLGRCA